ncbi:hypothetical protein BG015_003183, partial [Linnemannia schmuckeri]
MAYNHHRIFEFSHHVDFPPASLSDDIVSFPAPSSVLTPPPPIQASNLHLQTQLHAVQIQLQALTINADLQDYPAEGEDKDDDMMMIEFVDDFG